MVLRNEKIFFIKKTKSVGKYINKYFLVYKNVYRKLIGGS